MPRSRDPEELFAAACDGDRGALARVLSVVERGGADARHVGRLAHHQVGDTPGAGVGGYTVGVTGAPGAGKSTLTNALVGGIRAGGDRVAVLAIDPTSPFSGGAILGDRVRMQEHATDAGVFIRSMATRGHLGGLSLAAPAAIRVLGAIGWPWVLIETVGVGQVEVEIAGSADTTVVVVNPGWGDSVQANKAGLLEIADIFVINKCDRPGADETERDLVQMLELGRARDWDVPIVRTEAVSDRGTVELWAAIGAHRSHLVATGSLDHIRRERRRSELHDIVLATLEHRVRAVMDGERGRELLTRLAVGDVDPYVAADELLGRI